jgi:3',5'-cyclic AMP phosphodiesterase CpdA
MAADRSRTIVHLSDLHFGRDDPKVVDALAHTVCGLAPDVVAISGDLTQRARRDQFRQARDFLARLPQPQVVVPGNHDVPLFNLLARTFRPLGGYRRFITTDVVPVAADPLVWVAGVDTTRPLRWKSGRVRAAAVARIVELIAQSEPSAVKILVAHHPFDAPEGGAADTLASLVDAGIDVFLTGHLHASYTGHTAHRYNAAGRAAVVVEAGTSASTRVRHEPNAFNVLRVVQDAITVEQQQWDGAAFHVTDTQQFRRDSLGWSSA